MAKFNRKQHRMTNVVSPLLSEPGPSGYTYEGGPGWERTTESELFLLAVSSFGEGTFYETGGDRKVRLASLAQRAEPEFLAGFVPWLRHDANMRSAALMVAIEAGRQFAGTPFARAMVDAALQRADEPGEALAYWFRFHSHDIPAWLRRGVADAAVRLYDEFGYLKYNRRDATVTFADVIQLVQPRYHHKLWGTWRDDLYRYAIEQQHGRGTLPSEQLTLIRNNVAWRKNPCILPWPDYRLFGLTWEDVLSALATVPRKELWESLIPSMGYMALLRNLRNFDEAGVDDEHALQVINHLQDPVAVSRSRQFPFRFYAAYKAAPSLRWGYALELALHASLSNIPSLPGSTLILVDRSASMFDRFSARSDMMLCDAAALFGICLAVRAEAADLYEFGTGYQRIPVTGVMPVLRTMDHFHNLGGTQTAAALRATYRGHDRVVIITDEQAWDNVAGEVPGSIPVYTWNLGGYKYGHSQSGRNFRYTFGGLTDQSFRMIPLLEAGRWPWC